ncbi:helix-turn-helix domain-containing protein [Insolitispirillum peregrinum]|uniref:Bacteriophage CI repressor helix-turn-helix domain-containing protein n=1 Tax=Insolitispirillum peregrinum TaxID=80876 RepID=A0A1N7LSK4_9PROT|nr:helix-turn-helix domain-containing protein [Insolitispirillum peregrinum]SIS76759.1 Bacteriophage CI repressor helix-turn-helix domain-containing protein [Insolitispirillum peregrinum]
MKPSPTIDVEAVLTRIKDALKIQTDTQLGEYFEVSKKTISSWKSRNSMPIEFMLMACVATGKKIDYFIFGESIVREPTEFKLFDIDIMAAVGIHIATALLSEYAPEELAFMEEEKLDQIGMSTGLQIMFLMGEFDREKKLLLDSGKINRENYIEYIKKNHRYDLPYFAKALSNKEKL